MVNKHVHQHIFLFFKIISFSYIFSSPARTNQKLLTGLHGGPVDGDAFALHAAEPCHLALCELVDGGGELRAHLL